jgi:FkbM family methyltransferase
MSRRRRFRRFLFDLIPPYSRVLFDSCSRYVDRFNGDNDSNAETNGELVFLGRALPTFEPGAVVFDVGANVGTWMAWAIEINPSLSFHCFEPSKATHGILTQKHWPPNVRANNVGLGEIEELRDLHVVSDGSAMNSLYARRAVDGFEESTTEQIAITTIDAYCQTNGIERIALLKVDVEGHELAVFKGASHMMERTRIQAIQFEYGGCNLDSRVSLGDMWSLLARHGFDLYKLYPDGPHRIEHYQPELETFKYSNWVAIRDTRLSQVLAT